MYFPESPILHGFHHLCSSLLLPPAPGTQRGNRNPNPKLLSLAHCMPKLGTRSAGVDGSRAGLTRALLWPLGESPLLSVTQPRALHGLPGCRHHVLQGRMRPRRGRRRQGSPGQCPRWTGWPHRDWRGDAFVQLKLAKFQYKKKPNMIVVRLV